jgi:hypothetical protein
MSADAPALMVLIPEPPLGLPGLRDEQEVYKLYVSATVWLPDLAVAQAQARCARAQAYANYLEAQVSDVPPAEVAGLQLAHARAVALELELDAQAAIAERFVDYVSEHRADMVSEGLRLQEELVAPLLDRYSAAIQLVLP